MDNNGMFSGMGNTDTGNNGSAFQNGTGNNMYQYESSGNNTYGYNYGEYGNGVNNTNNTFGQSSSNQNTFGQQAMNQNTFGQNTNSTFGNNVSNTYNTTTSGAPNFYATDYKFNTSSNGYQEGLEEPMKVSEYLLILALVTLVPCVGLIMLIVWALSTTEKQSKVNFCRAYLIIMAISLALSLMAAIVMAAIV